MSGEPITDAELRGLEELPDHLRIVFAPFVARIEQDNREIHRLLFRLGEEAARRDNAYAAMREALEDAEALIRDGGIVPVKGITWSKVRSAIRAADGEET